MKQTNSPSSLAALKVKVESIDFTLAEKRIQKMSSMLKNINSFERKNNSAIELLLTNIESQKYTRENSLDTMPSLNYLELLKSDALNGDLYVEMTGYDKADEERLTGHLNYNIKLNFKGGENSYAFSLSFTNNDSESFDELDVSFDLNGIEFSDMVHKSDLSISEQDLVLDEMSEFITFWFSFVFTEGDHDVVNPYSKENEELLVTLSSI